MRRVAATVRSPALAIAVAVTPIVVAVVRALDRGWIPMGDNAYFSIRARDVLTEHHPLVGAWSSGSAAVGVDVNNLGPLQLDLLAPFVRALGFGPGTAIGVAVVNVGAVIMVVLLAERRLGAIGAWLGAAMAAATAWTLGSELLFEPRQHHALVLPFLALLVGVWSLVRGDRRALPATALVASLLVQTHLTFALPTLALSVLGVVGAVIATRTEPGDPTDRWRSWRGSAVVTAAVLALCWVQPLVEELQAGQGNISAVREAAGADSTSLGLGPGARAVATVVAPPDGWWRPSFGGFDPVDGLMSGGGAAGALALVAALHVGLAWWAARRAERAVAAWSVTALAALGVSVLAAASSPISGPFGAVSGNYRYLWPVSVFTTGALLASAIRLAGRRVDRVALPALGVLTLGLALLALPTSYQSPGPEEDAPLIPVARSLRAQVLDHGLDGPVAVDRSGLFFGEPYTYVVLAALQETGIDLVLDAPTDLSRFGDGRERDGAVEGTITFAAGAAALEDRPGSELLARASLLDDDELDALAGGEDALPRQRSDVALERGTVAVWFEPSP
jgi:hypothetical protein